MKILAIDWGEVKLGLAYSDGVLAEPLAVITPEKLDIFINQYQPELVLVGVSENKSGQKAKAFGKKLQEEVGIKVEFVDESLTTKEAQILSREAGIGRKRRRDMEDAYAATILLQNYLDAVKRPLP